MTRSFLRTLACVTITVASAAPASPASRLWNRIGPEGGTISAFLALPARPATLYAGFNDGGIYRSDDRGATWRYAGEGSGRLGIRGLAADARGRQTLYAASGSLSVVKTVDGGQSWKPAARGIPFAPLVPVVSVATDAKLPGVAYAAVNAGAIYKTIDGGQSWKPLAAAAPRAVNQLVADPRAQGTVYAVTAPGELWKTANGGRRWRPMHGALASGLAVLGLQIDPRDSSRLFARVYGGDAVQLFASTDGGKTWAPPGGLLADEVRALAIDPSNPATLHVGTNDAILRSDDAGKTWRATGAVPPGSQFGLFGAPGAVIAQPFGKAIYRTANRGASWALLHGIRAVSGKAIAVAPGPRLYARVFDFATFAVRSDDDGATWQSLVPIDDRPYRRFGPPLTLDPAHSSTIYAGFDDVLGLSLDGGDRFDVTSSPNCLFPRELTIDPRDTANLYLSGEPRGGSACDNGAERCATYRKLGETSWECIDANLPGLGLPVAAVDPFDGATLYAVIPGTFGAVLRSDDRGATWPVVAPIDFLASLAPDPTRPGVVYAGFLGGVGRSEDHAETWTFSRTGLPRDEFVNQLLVDPTRGDTLYAVTPSNVWRSDDGGRTWRAAGAGLEESVVVGMAVDPEDPSVLYAAAAGGGVLRLDQP